MEGQRDAGWMLQCFIHNYLPTLGYNPLTFPPKNALNMHEEAILHYKETYLQVTVITGIIISF